MLYAKLASLNEDVNSLKIYLLITSFLPFPSALSIAYL